MFKHLVENPIVLADKKLVYYFDQLLAAFKARTLKSEGALLNELFNLFKKFYGNVGSPEFGLQFKVTPREGLDSTKYNAMINALFRDLTISYEQQNSLDQSLIVNYNYFELKKEAILNLLKECNEHVNRIESIAKSKNTANIELGEFFDTDYAFDYSMSTRFVNFDSTVGGVTLKLHRTDQDIRNYIGNVTVQTFFDGKPLVVGGLDNSTSDGKMYGVYGDNGENGRRIGLSLIADYLSNAPAPAAETGTTMVSSAFEGISFDVATRNISLLSKLFDVEGEISNLNTFLEFEYTILLNKPVPTIKSTLEMLDRAYKTVAIHYNQPFVPSKDDHKLSLIMTVNLTEPLPVNHIQIATHNFGETNYVNVKNLKVLDNNLHTIEGFSKENSLIKSQSSSIANSNYSNAKKWIFPSTDITQIVIELEQESAHPVRYSMLAAKRGWRSGTARAADLWDISSKRLFKDILEIYGPSIAQYPEAINSYIDEGSKTPWKYVKAYKRWQYAILSGFGNQGFIDIPRDESNRFRYAIGLSNILFGLFKYAEFSEFISKPLVIGNVRQIQLETSDMIPESFPIHDWIKYYVSFDDALTWHRINPFNHPEKKFEDGLVVPKTIYCNSEIPEEFKTRNKSGKYAFVEIEDKNKTIRIKSELSRPVEPKFEAMTPIVYEIKLNLMALKT